MTELVLASKSPRRQLLLQSMGYDFKVITRETEESFPTEYSPEEAVQHIAQNKARSLDELSHKHVVVAADTIVVLNGRILGKPSDQQEAIDMLKALSGHRHDVMTACCINYETRIQTIIETTRVYFRSLRDSEILYYVHNFQPYDKAGSYGIQEWIGAVGVDRIEGSYNNVVGLPTTALYEALRSYPLNHPLND